MSNQSCFFDKISAHQLKYRYKYAQMYEVSLDFEFLKKFEAPNKNNFLKLVKRRNYQVIKFNVITFCITNHNIVIRTKVIFLN